VAISMRHPPGSRDWSYSSTNYVLAGMLIQAVTGRGWEREVHERIIAPLGLRRTLTPGSWPFLPDPHATNYQQFAPGAELTDTTIAIRGLDSGADGSMISTPTEVNRFFAALAGGRLLAPAQWAQLRELVDLPDDSGDPPGSGSGLGVFYTPLSCGGGYWNHGGTGFGYWVEPAVTSDGRRKLTFSMFSNTFDPDLAATRQALVRDTIDRALCS
jgi:D-alanyl-D-alanine carboxypeptidase